MAQSLFGMARVVRGYSTINKLLERGYTQKEISKDFEVDFKHLDGFYQICTKLSTGETVFRIDACDKTSIQNMAKCLA